MTTGASAGVDLAAMSCAWFDCDQPGQTPAVVGDS